MTTVGEILKSERINKGLTLHDIEMKIKVREKYLRAVEENNWSFFTSRIYITGIIRNYSKVLNQDEKKVLAFFRRDYEKKDDVRFKKGITSRYLSPETKLVLRNGFIVLILFFIIYFSYQLKLYFSPPGLELISPTTTSFFREDKINITGKTDKDTTVMITGQRIYQNADGVFVYEFPLKDGTNKLIIELTGANGRKTTYEKIFTKTSSR